MRDVGEGVPILTSEPGPACGPTEAFVARWKASGAAERANYQLFLSELCDLLDVPRPDPAGPHDAGNAYVFERNVTFRHGDGSTSVGRIDLYKRGCFVLEAKQGVDQKAGGPGLLAAAAAPARRGTGVRGTRGWDDAMLRARGQAEAYAKALPVDEGWPPFLVIVDVGHSIELWADFSRSGKHYTQFPDASSFRILLDQLRAAETQGRLRQVWTDPLALDPARHSARVTRDIADRLARLAKSLEAAGHAPKSVASFLMRCLFTMFAEDVELLPKGSFRQLLESLKGEEEKFPPLARSLWETMNTGGFSPVLREKLLAFNGGLFQDADALPLNGDQLALLIEAAAADWRDVEPAIFGTLLERALEPTERHKLGAHYTPRAYVERLVMPTVIEPLRDDWDNVKAAAVALAARGETDKARKEVTAFHRKLCETRVLDPACGSGNFLYVTLEHMKRLEGEVVDLLRELGEDQYLLEMERHSVDPHQFLGIEVNPRAAAIAELVLWIGYLQWHFRTRGRTMPAEPVLRNFKNIECRDAVLAWDKIELARDEAGKPITRWDGRTTKKSPVTGEDVPDDTAQVEEYRYVNPRPAEWPAAEFIVGNPPYIGNKRMRLALGDGYVEALRFAYPGVPGSVDLVMYWWHQAASLVRLEKAARFGLITTNTITQPYNRKLVDTHRTAKRPLSILYAVPDHPWVDSIDGAAVRVAMTVGANGFHTGFLQMSMQEGPAGEDAVDITFQNRFGLIGSDLSIGPDIMSAEPLLQNEWLCWQGCKLVGKHFQISPEQRQVFISDDPAAAIRLPRYWAGSDIVQNRNERYVIDLFGLTETQARRQHPALMQHLIDWVLPERRANRDRAFREKWWLFGRPRPDFRRANGGIKRFIATSEVAKHRLFVFLNWPGDLTDGSIIAVAHSDGAILGILSSRPHTTWCLHAGGTLEDRPRYHPTTCFDPFPFPVCTEALKARIRALGEQLDRHRKERQALHPDLTLTGMYNVLEKLRRGEALTTKEKDIHEKGLVSVLRRIHDELDRAVFDAYGWPADLTDEAILERLVALNRERAAEEKRGLVRWLRPEFQAPEAARAARPEQVEMEVEAPAAAGKAGRRPWPKALPEQVQAVRFALLAQGAPAGGAEIARAFKGARAERIDEVLAALAALGQARHMPDGRYAA